MLHLAFEGVWLDGGPAVAVDRKHALTPFFQKRA
jgi:hypothetical protein